MASIQRGYDLHSLYCGTIVAPLEVRPRRLALEKACLSLMSGYWK
jgi:hypothetical protein